MKNSFTNRLSLYLCCLLVVDTLLSFVLSLYSINQQYTGALPFYTICVTPVNAGIAWVLNSSVNKSRDENTGPNGEGINYMKYMNSPVLKEDEI